MSDLSDCLDTLCPMHMQISAEGLIHHIGPTLHKVWCDGAFEPVSVFAACTILRPRMIRSMSDLLRAKPDKLRIRLNDAPDFPLRATLATRAEGGIVLDLSFGIHLSEAVARHNLSGRDFAPSDLSIDMLYLLEAKAAAMASSRGLNDRLDTARATAEAEALTDPLTGLANRRGLMQALDRRLSRPEPCAVLHVDLDHFKAVNDTSGHAAGDAALKAAARRMTQAVRAGDLVARVGGDEFVLVLTGLTDCKTLKSLAERVIRDIEAPIPLESGTALISASIGIALSDPNTANAASLIAAADEALYAVKAAGRGHVRFAA